MANSSTNLQTISSSQSGKEVTANGLFDAASPATAFGRRPTSTGLQWDYYGGTVLVDGVLTQIGNGNVTLSNATNFVERTRAGTVSTNTTSFTPGRVPLYQVVASGSVVTSFTDYRSTEIPTPTGYVSITVSTADITLSYAQAECRIIKLAGTPAAGRNIIVPTAAAWWIIHNTTGQTMTIKTAAGSGYAIATGFKTIVYCDGTDVLQATADL